jgi:hypothetical protein
MAIGAMSVNSITAGASPVGSTTAGSPLPTGTSSVINPSDPIACRPARLARRSPAVTVRESAATSTVRARSAALGSVSATVYPPKARLTLEDGSTKQQVVACSRVPRSSARVRWASR